jgi:hypothetical protein
VEGQTAANRLQFRHLEFTRPTTAEYSVFFTHGFSFRGSRQHQRLPIAVAHLVLVLSVTVALAGVRVDCDHISVLEATANERDFLGSQLSCASAAEHPVVFRF